MTSEGYNSELKSVGEFETKGGAGGVRRGTGGGVTSKGQFVVKVFRHMCVAVAKDHCRFSYCQLILLPKPQSWARRSVACRWCNNWLCNPDLDKRQSDRSVQASCVRTVKEFCESTETEKGRLRSRDFRYEPVASELQLALRRIRCGTSMYWYIRCTYRETSIIY